VVAERAVDWGDNSSPQRHKLSVPVMSRCKPAFRLAEKFIRLSVHSSTGSEGETESDGDFVCAALR